MDFLFSIRFRLVLWFALILGLVLAGFSAFIYIRQVRETEAIVYNRLRLKLDRLVGGPRQTDRDYFNAFPGLTGGSDPWNAWFQVGDVLAVMAVDGSVQQSWGSLTEDSVKDLKITSLDWSGGKEFEIDSQRLTDQPEATGKVEYMFISAPVVQNNQVAGYILMGTPFDPNRQLGLLLASLAIGSTLTLLVALVGGFWLADRAMRPVQVITETAHKISETDLNLRLELKGRDELARLADTFDDMLGRLQAAFERQRQFTADASHEMRTPLTIIDLEASRALSARRSGTEYERVLHVIQSENRFMTRLVNNLLALARMDAGQVVLQQEPVDMGDLALEIVERLTPLAEARQTRLQCGNLPELIVTGDRQYLQQMVTNLVENALKYGTSQDPQVCLEVNQVNEDGQDWADLRVIDNGPGIAPEHLEHLFDRFYRVDKVRSQSEVENAAEEETSSGTGLGLAIVQWIVKAHQGKIRVQSQVGAGSTFEVLLPLAE